MYVFKITVFLIWFPENLNFSQDEVEGNIEI